MRRVSFGVILTMAVSLLLVVLACPRQAPVDTRAEEEGAIRAADAACLKAAQEKDVDRTVSCFADDAGWLVPNSPIANGKDAIRAAWSQFLATPGFTIDWQITKVEVSRAGDLAYTLYTYQMSMQGPGDKPISDRGKDVAVWKKQPDGSWKIVADALNSDLPLPGPAKPK